MGSLCISYQEALHCLDDFSPACNIMLCAVPLKERKSVIKPGTGRCCLAHSGHADLTAAGV